MRAPQGKCMRREPRKLHFQLSVVSIVSSFLSLFHTLTRARAHHTYTQTHTQTVTRTHTRNLTLRSYTCAATVFAYGQTSSGKTHTMTGITEYTVADIYDYIKRVRYCPHLKKRKCSLFCIYFCLSPVFI